MKKLIDDLNITILENHYGWPIKKLIVFFYWPLWKALNSGHIHGLELSFTLLDCYLYFHPKNSVYTI
jgi:hypothetical protein